MLEPQDIRKHEFTRAWRGYDRDEVHALLDAITRDFEDVTHRNATLAGELKELRDEAARHQKSEKTLQDAALVMQQVLEDKRRAAEEEAASLLQEARGRIAEETRAAAAQVDSLRAQLQTLENERARFYLRFQNLLSEQSALLESLMDTPADTPADTPDQDVRN
jgi:cell division initiation protein